MKLTTPTFYRSYLSYENCDVEVNGKLYEDCTIRAAEGFYDCFLILENEKATHEFKVKEINTITIRRK